MSPVGGATSLDFFSDIDMKEFAPVSLLSCSLRFASLRENSSYKPFTTRVIPFFINSTGHDRLVYRFEQTWSERSVNLKSRVDDLCCNFIFRHGSFTISFLTKAQSRKVQETG